ncbi:MAG: hypothetical protein Fur0015_04080 [Ignavibacteriales bacterium]
MKKSFLRFVLLALIPLVVQAQTPVTPADGATGVSASLTTISWTHFDAFTPGDGPYEFKLDSDNDPNNGELESQAGITTNSATLVTVLSAGTLYYWHVRDTDTDGPGPNGAGPWNTYSFTVDLSSPTLTAPINGVTGVSIFPTFNWDVVAGAVSYKLYIDNANTFATPIFEEPVLTNSRTLTELDSVLWPNLPLKNDSLYYWKVSSVDGGAVEHFSSVSHFTAYKDFNVILSWPSDSVTLPPVSLTFAWYTLTSTTNLKFDLQLAMQTTSPTAAEWATATTYSNITETTKTVTNLVGGKTYFWRVVAKNTAGDIVKYSPVNVLFTNGGTANTIYPSWPIGGATVYSLTPTAYWYMDQLSTGFKFQIAYSKTDDGSPFDNLDVAFTPATLAAGTTDFFIDFPTLDANTTYYWQVIGEYTSGAFMDTLFSAQDSFKTYSAGAGVPVVPTISYPTDSIAVYTQNPYLYWYLGADGTGLTYDIDFATLTAGLDGVADSTGITATFKQFLGLTPGETYVFAVRSNNGSTTSAWSDPDTFYVVGGVGNVTAIPSYPVDSLTVYTDTPTLSWYLNGSSLGLTKYTVRWKAGSNSSDWNTVYDGTADVTDINTPWYTVSPALNWGTTYWWAVAVYDGTNYSTWTYDSFAVTNTTTSFSLVPVTPIDGVTVSAASVDFNWYAIGDVSSYTNYTLVYSYSDVFAPGATTTVNIAIASNIGTYNATLIPGATYFWKVGVDGGSYSSVDTFYTSPGSNPIQPLVGSPNKVVIGTTAPTLSWVVTNQPASELLYEVEVASTPDFSDAKQYSNISKKHFDVSNLEAGKNYYWRVRSKKADDGSLSLYSGTGNFKINDVTDVKENIIPTKFSVDQNYPNPFNPETSIRFSVPEASIVSIRIYDMLGQEIKTLVNKEFSAGTFTLNWKGDDNFGRKVSSGTYIYRVVNGNNVATKKMVLLK